jgi:hypothetical protein
LLELRTACDLARRSAGARRAAEGDRPASVGLAPGFSDGFDTADLQEAEALLDNKRALTLNDEYPLCGLAKGSTGTP